MTAAIFDLREMLTGKRDLQAGADAAIGVGLMGAALAAITGLNDWQYTRGNTRRVGVLHAVLNSTAASTYLASWLLRRRGQRAAGHALGLLGFAWSMAGAYLGGKLAYGERVGVDHAPRRELPEEFTSVMLDAELPEGEPHRAEVGGVHVLLVRQNGQIFALGETCAHMGGPLADGHLEGNSIRCPWHGSRYQLDTGEVLEGPSVHPQPVFETRVRDGRIEVRVKS
jgi:nitrite reductase/ring-hydroxylating ferredoxin subunit/uncharacterized membrane protein